MKKHIGNFSPGKYVIATWLVIDVYIVSFFFITLYDKWRISLPEWISWLMGKSLLLFIVGFIISVPASVFLIWQGIVSFREYSKQRKTVLLYLLINIVFILYWFFEAMTVLKPAS